MSARATPRPPRSRGGRPAGAARCRQAADLWAYLDGELPSRRARTVAAHVSTCAACLAVASRLHTMLAACRTAGCQALPADVRARARERARALVRGR